MDKNYVRDLDKWFDDEENCRLHYDAIRGLEMIPFPIAIDVCRKYLDDCGYQVIPKGVEVVQDDDLICVIEDIFKRR